MIMTINVDCTPEEARAFLGLPDPTPVQDSITQQMQEQMAERFRISPEEMLKSWMPAMRSFEQMQDDLFQ